MMVQMHKEVHRELLSWALLLALIIGVTVMMIQAEQAPLLPFVLGMCLIALVQVVWSLRDRALTAAVWVFVLGECVLIAIGWWQYPRSPIHHMLVLPIMTATLTQGLWMALAAAMLAGGVMAFGMIHLTHATMGYLLGELGILYAVTFLAIVSQRLQARIIRSAWENYCRARDNLQLALSRQLELKQALEDLAQANEQTVRLNDMLSAAQQAVEDARRAKEAFVANVSHELRTPLNMIISFSDMILETPEAYAHHLPPALLADIAAIKRNSQHLAELVDDVLALSEAEVGRLQLALEPVVMAHIVREAVEAVRVLVEKKGLELIVDVPQDLPLIHCDRTRIRQVLLNLLGNAARFTEKGSIRIWVEAGEGQITTHVSDTGPGIDPKQAVRVFEPFWQGDASIRRRYGGTGLGLAISKRFVESHGGRIWIDSKLNAGTTVSFSLPLEQPREQEAVHRWFSPYHDYTPRTRPSRAPVAQPPASMVIVEGESSLSNLLQRNLNGMQLISVPSIQEAAKVVDSHGAEAIVINAFHLPDGRHVVESLPMRLDVPIIFCHLPERHMLVERMGAQDYLVKPIKREKLLHSLGQCVREGRTVLVADDDEEARQLFGRMLTAAGYTVLDAEDGVEALDLLRERHPDALLLDLIMPNLDGMAVLEAKARDETIRDIPVIIISAKDIEEEPVVSHTLTLTRQRGLSTRDLSAAIEALTRTLKPRFAAPTLPGTLDGS